MFIHLSFYLSIYPAAIHPFIYPSFQICRSLSIVSSLYLCICLLLFLSIWRCCYFSSLLRYSFNVSLFLSLSLFSLLSSLFPLLSSLFSLLSSLFFLLSLLPSLFSLLSSLFSRLSSLVSLLSSLLSLSLYLSLSLSLSLCKFLFLS